MAPDETTHLLANPKPEPAPPLHSDSEDNHASTAQLSRKFAPWQLGALFGILLAYSDTSLVWATHETVASSFNNLANSSWMMTSFNIGYCVTLPLYGRLSGSYGRIRPLVAAYCIFCVGCALCGAGQEYWQVIVGRVITGCGASGMISLASIIITDIAAPSEVAILRSYVNVAATTGLSLGGPLGGFLAVSVGWRWSFLGQVPVAAACCLLIALGLRALMPATEEQVQSTHDADLEIKPAVLTFDFPGAITLALAVSSFLAVIDMKGKYDWENPLIITMTAVGLASLISFIALEKYPGSRNPLIPLWLLRTEVGPFCIAQMLIIGGGHAFISHVAPYFSNTQGASDAQAAQYLVPASIGNAVGSIIAGLAIRKFGCYKKISLLATFLCILNSIYILVEWSHPIVWEAVAIMPSGFFPGVILSAQFIGLATCAPKQQVATAISLYYMSQQIGIAIGISVSSSLLQTQFKETLYKLLVDIPDYKEIVRRILSDSSAVSQMPAAIQALVAKGYLHSFWVVPALLTATHVLAIIPMLSTTEATWD